MNQPDPLGTIRLMPANTGRSGHQDEVQLILEGQPAILAHPDTPLARFLLALHRRGLLDVYQHPRSWDAPGED